MKIAVGCDHAAVEHKNAIRDYLIENGVNSVGSRARWLSDLRIKNTPRSG